MKDREIRGLVMRGMYLDTIARLEPEPLPVKGYGVTSPRDEVHIVKGAAVGPTSFLINHVTVTHPTPPRCQHGSKEKPDARRSARDSTRRRVAASNTFIGELTYEDG